MLRIPDQRSNRARLVHAHITEKARREEQRRLAISQSEMAQALGISTATAGRMLRNGVVRSIKIGQRRLIPMSEIEKLLEDAA